MQGQVEVINFLNKLLVGELGARDQYFIHSRMYQDWGFTKLYERLDHEMQEETAHADALIQRILFLEGTPDMSRGELNIGQDVPNMLSNDLKTEYYVRGELAKGIALCEKLNDFISRDILKMQLQDTEQDHAYWLEKQLGLIKKVGLENYLQSQM